MRIIRAALLAAAAVALAAAAYLLRENIKRPTLPCRISRTNLMPWIQPRGPRSLPS